MVEFPPDRFKRLFDINVAGTFIVAQAVAREVIKANVSASMIFIGSISGSVSNRVCFQHDNVFFDPSLTVVGHGQFRLQFLKSSSASTCKVTGGGMG